MTIPTKRNRTMNIAIATIISAYDCKFDYK